MTKYPRLHRLNNRNFFTVLELRSLRSRCQWIRFLVRTLFPACRQLCPHMALSSVCAQGGREPGVSPSLIRLPFQQDQGPTLMTSPNPNYLLKAPLPNPITLGLRASTYKLGRGNNSVHYTGPDLAEGPQLVDLCPILSKSNHLSTMKSYPFHPLCLLQL